MFVLPPPPRYPTSGLPNIGIIETNNTLSHPTGSEYQLVVGEGTYILREDLHLATPPPHPSEAPVQNPNPLATAVLPFTAGCKLSVVVLTPKLPSSSHLNRVSTIGSNPSPFPPSIQEQADVQSTDSEGGSYRKSNGFAGYTNGHIPTFGEGNPAMLPVNQKESKDPSKRRKPKNNIVKSNSSFVSRVIPHESLSKRLQERNAQGRMAFVNINRAMQWLDLSSLNMDEQLTKILFTKAHVLCHDINPLTRAPGHLDMIIGFSTGDVIWYEPLTQKYTRINKNLIINNTPITDIKWIPGSENLFMAAHADGSLVVYDKEKEDAPFVPEESLALSTEARQSKDANATFQVKKSVQSRNQKTNPVAYWKVASSRINAFAFSPDRRHLAAVTEDGTMKIIDYLKEELLDIYPSYYDGFICVCWSPDGRYIITGGQDDLVSIWSLEDKMLVARCQGHGSWVTAVAFDPWRCDDRNYRFGSVGEDCKLLLWDFSVGMLHRPRAASVRQRSNSTRVDSSVTRLRPDLNSSNLSIDSQQIVHALEPRARTAMLPPVLAKKVDEHPISWLGFEEDCIITTCKEGHIRTWDRPKEGASSEGEINGSVSASEVGSG